MTEEPSALRRWMTAGPEVNHLVAKYETASEAKEVVEHFGHHEQTKRAQKLFLEKIEKLSQVMTNMGNPFQEESCDLLCLDTKDIAHPRDAELVGRHFEMGRLCFQEFMKGLKGEEGCRFYDPIKKNRVDFFRQEPASVGPLKQRLLK